jgi:hypothetical protein
MSRHASFCFKLVLVAIGLAWPCTSALAGSGDTNTIFERYKNRIVQIRVLEASSGARALIGSGFLVSAAGHIVTNYHVVSDLVHRPKQYRAEIVHHDGTTGPFTLLKFDAVHDLAIVKTTPPKHPYLELHTQPLGHGVRVFSLGTPLDLGFTIVEGTYSGLLADSLHERIHFTGSINAGMSGGPALTSDGRVVGVNVASAGNQVSFLVPAKFVRQLLDDTMLPDQKADAPALEQLRAQLLANQNRYMEKLLARPLTTTVLGRYRLPGKIAPFLRCWGDSDYKKDRLYHTTSWDCSAQNYLYVSRSQLSGTLNFSHELVASDTLDRFRFFALYQEFFSQDAYAPRADKEDVGKFDCVTEFVTQNDLTFKAVLCLRAYKKLPGLYDAVLKAATLNDNNQGVLTTLTLGGVSFENATRFARHYLGSIAWAK